MPSSNILRIQEDRSMYPAIWLEISCMGKLLGILVKPRILRQPSITCNTHDARRRASEPVS